VSVIKWFLFFIAIIGVVLFLYGANYYEAAVGWVGVSFFVAGVVGFLVLYVYGELMKGNQVQKP
jgi:hypothetical protein